MEPDKNCALCPRLAAFRQRQRHEHPDWFNAPVPAFGDRRGRLLVVGLAPGRQGANRTGRPFTGDYAGDLLYAALAHFGFSRGLYTASPDDGLILSDCAIVNAVRCLPPQNKPLGREIAACNGFLARHIAAMTRLEVILSLGRVAHNAVLKTQEMTQVRHGFRHGACHGLPGGRRLFNSYHCSRYNTNTGRLTAEMFYDVLAAICATLGSGGSSAG